MNELSDFKNIDELEAVMMTSGLPVVEFEVKHRFAPGMYIREIFIPANSLLTSAEHRTAHPFVISQGRIAVVSATEGSVIYEAPYTGITQPGTRRVLHAQTDTVWITFHVTDETDIEKICAHLVEPPDNPLLPDHVPGYLRNLPPKIES